MRVVAFILALICVAFPARAEEDSALPKGLKIDSYLTLQANALDNADLGTADNDRRDTFLTQARVRASYRFNKNMLGLVDARAVGIGGDSGGEDETGRINTNEDYLELRQFWLKYSAGDAAVQAGRQRIKEEAALWWNRDIEAALVLYEGDRLNGFAGIAQAFDDYRTTDSFRASQEDRLRVMGETSWQWRDDHFLEGRFLYEDDHSGTRNTGDVIRTHERDDEDGKFVWAGVRSSGIFKGVLADSIKYKIDTIALKGDETEETSSGIAGTDFRTVTGRNDRDVFGWGFDARADIGLGRPVLRLGYAFGSGDDGSDTDHEFRQSGLHSNSSRPGVSSGSVYDYGEVLRPELSNLHIFTLGGGLPFGDFGDLNLFYHYYRLDENATDMRSSLVSAPLNGSDKFVGQEADVILNLSLSKVFDLENTALKGVNLRTSFGVFRAGDAYGAAEGENAVRAFSELVFRF